MASLAHEREGDPDMFQNTRRTCSVLGAAAASTLCAGLAVVAGIVPHSDAAPSVRAAAVPVEAVPTVPEVAPRPR